MTHMLLNTLCQCTRPYHHGAQSSTNYCNFRDKEWVEIGGNVSAPEHHTTLDNGNNSNVCFMTFVDISVTCSTGKTTVGGVLLEYVLALQCTLVCPDLILIG